MVQEGLETRGDFNLVLLKEGGPPQENQTDLPHRIREGGREEPIQGGREGGEGREGGKGRQVPVEGTEEGALGGGRREGGRGSGVLVLARDANGWVEVFVPAPPVAFLAARCRSSRSSSSRVGVVLMVKRDINRRFRLPVLSGPHQVTTLGRRRGGGGEGRVERRDFRESRNSGNRGNGREGGKTAAVKGGRQGGKRRDGGEAAPVKGGREGGKGGQGGLGVVVEAGPVEGEVDGAGSSLLCSSSSSGSSRRSSSGFSVSVGVAVLGVVKGTEPVAGHGQIGSKEAGEGGTCGREGGREG